eukprot:754001-Prorocentrum_minimum.AAC.5
MRPSPQLFADSFDAERRSLRKEDLEIRLSLRKEDLEIRLSLRNFAGARNAPEARSVHRRHDAGLAQVPPAHREDHELVRGGP